MEMDQMLKAARKWLCRQYYTESEANAFPDGRVYLSMDRLYTGGWAQFESDTSTVAMASEWELSW